MYTSTMNGLLSHHCEWEFGFICEVSYGEIILLLYENLEYSSTFTSTLGAMKKNTAKFIDLTIKCMLEDTTAEPVLVISFENAIETYFWRGIPLKYFMKM